jgi:hypothetical protein
MKHTPLLAAILLLFAVGPVRAQLPYNRPQTSPFGQPAVSPYLNLLRQGTNPAINYYGIVRPQIDTQSSIMQLQQQMAVSAATGGTQDTTGGVLFTGHPTQFMNLSHYFGGAAARPATPAARPQTGTQTPPPRTR